MNKEFYERILVAKFIERKFKTVGKEYTINECFNYVQVKGDTDLVDMIWFSITGSKITWENHLEDICFGILGVNRAQPGYSPFLVEEKVMSYDPSYKDWFVSEWTPYILGLVKKYRPVWAPRLESKITRGMYDIVSDIDNTVSGSTLSSSNVW